MYCFRLYLSDLTKTVFLASEMCPAKLSSCRADSSHQKCHNCRMMALHSQDWCHLIHIWIMSFQNGITVMTDGWYQMESEIRWTLYDMLYKKPIHCSTTTNTFFWKGDLKHDACMCIHGRHPDWGGGKILRRGGGRPHHGVDSTPTKNVWGGVRWGWSHLLYFLQHWK